MYRVLKGGRWVRVQALPISIPFARFSQLSDTAKDTVCNPDTKVREFLKGRETKKYPHIQRHHVIISFHNI